VRSTSARRRVWIFAAAALAATGCVSTRDVTPVEPTHVSHLTQIGDAQRRASLRLVVAGLDADAAGQSERALANYRRAIQVDATNPYAYVALARHWIEAGDSERGILFLDQAEVLLESSDESTLGVQVHLIGLRGRAAAMGGHSDEAEALLRLAAEQAPDVWGDGMLGADELK
jgi:Flp pilus assembly protein TadD